MRTVIVTGGASGIGAATARAFAELGDRVVIFDINGDGAKQVAAELPDGLAVQIDVSDQDATRQAVSELGPVHALVNCAVSFIAKGLDVTTAEWERSLGVNVRGYANMVQAVHEPMRSAGGGAIVNVASISAHVAQPDRWTYNACKGAILNMTRCMALDLGPDKIRVNVVSPGWIWTPEVAKAANGDRKKWEPVWGRFHILRRLGEASEVADAIVYLCSDKASFITGAELPVDGGYLAMGSEGLGDQSSFAGTE